MSNRQLLKHTEELVRLGRSIDDTTKHILKILAQNKEFFQLDTKHLLSFQHPSISNITAYKVFGNQIKISFTTPIKETINEKATLFTISSSYLKNVSPDTIVGSVTNITTADIISSIVIDNLGDMKITNQLSDTLTNCVGYIYLQQ